jgi:hypothetical protein
MVESMPNRYGRRPGRGWRPWLLLPKVMAVGLYTGGLAAAIVVWFGSGFSGLDKADPQRLWIINLIGRLMIWLVVPSLLLAILLGVGLFAQFPSQFIRMRWMLVKLASLAVLIPAAHLFLSSRLGLIRDAFMRQTTQEGAECQFGWGLVVTLMGSLWIVVLGRLKPRLGQNWART